MTQRSLLDEFLGKEQAERYRRRAESIERFRRRRVAAGDIGANVGFDAVRWAGLNERDRPSTQPRSAPKPESPVSSAEVLRIVRAEVAAFRKSFIDQLYRDITEAIPPHVQRELRRSGGHN
jgi:hypothetical protein